MPADTPPPTLLIDGPRRARTTFVLAHGAGAPMDTPFMSTVAEGLAGHGIRVVRFEFPYMAKRREDGRRRGPDRAPVLLDAFRAAIDAAAAGTTLAIGGKSMGGRMAAMLAAGDAPPPGLAGVVCLGYPFHPPGKPDNLRLEPLRAARLPVLVVQGERDPFGGRDEVPGYAVSARVRVAWIGDGDHSLVPRKRSGRSEAENLGEAISATAEFIAGLA